MATKFAVAFSDEQATAIANLARRYGITEEEVVTQLIDLGLEAVEEPAP
jgi:hypothetical protein